VGALVKTPARPIVYTHETRKTRNVEIWRQLLKELRAANPSQTIALERGSYVQTRDILIDGTKIELSLENEFNHNTTEFGRFYFKIGKWVRNRTRLRAVEGVKGFDWARIAQLVENERKREAAQVERDKLTKKKCDAAAGLLKTLWKRRPELKELFEVHGDVDEGRFEFELQGLDVGQLEAALDIALDVKRIEEASDG